MALVIGLVSAGGKPPNDGFLGVFVTVIEAGGENLSASIDDGGKVVEG